MPRSFAIPVLAILAALLLAPSARAQSTVAEGDLQRHLQAIFDAALANGGNRAAGTKGETATGDYAADRLAEAGWMISRTDVRFPYWSERRPAVVGAYRYGRDYVTLHYSGRGDVRARVVAVDRGGCRKRAFRRFPRGRIAALTASGCGFRRAVILAQRAGAKAVIVADYGNGAPAQGTLIKQRGIRIPAVSVRLPVARRIARRRSPIRIAVDVIAEPRVTQNVIAELPGTDPSRVVMAGGHIDSVPRGAGMNDNGSGVAALIEMGRHLAGRPHGATLRIGLWAAHEPGVYGANRYVGALPAEERRRIAAYVNVDMVGSPNGFPELFFNRRALGGVLRRHLEGAGRTSADLAGDADPFRRAGVPIGGFYTGSVEPKERSQVRRWGGRVGVERDGCYHTPCDVLTNVDLKLLGVTATAATNAVEELAR